MTSPCPTDLELRRYALGDCPDDSFALIEEHLTACPACEETIARFDGTDDTLMRHLPLAAGGPSVEQAEPVGWLDALRHGPPAAGSLSAVLPDLEPSAGVPDQLANYELLQVIGQGGMGVVFLAQHRQLKRRVAIKVVSPKVMSGIEAQRRFQREIEVLGGLHHPGIVMATDAGRLGQGAYLVMELIDGADLARLVRVGGPLGIPEACEAARQVALALAAAHACGAVHRDVKPSNVMVDRTGRVRLLDFGLAQVATTTQQSLDTSIGRLLGTIEYMAPEQIDGPAQTEPRADLYGLGALLFYLLTGRPPHGSRSQRPVLEHLRSIANNDAPRLGTLRADVPPELDEFVAQLLSRDPALRPATAESAAESLNRWAGGSLSGRVREFLEEHPSQVPGPDDREAAKRSLTEVLDIEPSQPQAQAAPVPPRRRWPLVAALAALAGALLWGVVITLQTPQGTLRIESEVGDVQVEVVDEQNESHPLDISQGPDNETVLRAGKYRVRFKGASDGLRIVGEEITLRKGETVVARIVREQTSSEVANAPAVFPAPAAGMGPYTDEQKKQIEAWIRENSPGPIRPEAVYQGLSESEWSRRFLAETEPVAKLDAGKALLSLASGRPDAEVIERILFVGEEIVRAGWGNRAMELPLTTSAFPNGIFPVWNGPSGASRRGRGGSGFGGRGGRGGGNVIVATRTLWEAATEVENQVGGLAANLDAVKLAEHLCNSAKNAAEPRAAFALMLLRRNWVDLSESELSRQAVLSGLAGPVTDEIRSQVLCLVRVRYLKSRNDAGVDNLLDELTKLARHLLETTPAELALIENVFHSSLYYAFIQVKGLEFPRELRRLTAQLELRDLGRGNAALSDPARNNRGGGGFSQAFVSVNDPLSRLSAELEYLPNVRLGIGGSVGAGQQSGVIEDGVTDYRTAIFSIFIDEWLPVANAWLAEHPHAFDSVQFRKVVRSMFLVSQLRQPGDDWPVEETARLLTELLKSYYDLPDNTAPLPTQWDDPNAAMLLGTIVRLTGKLPEFLGGNGEILRSRNVANANWVNQLRSGSQQFNAATTVESRSVAIDFFTERLDELRNALRHEPLRITAWAVDPAQAMNRTSGSAQFLAATAGNRFEVVPQVVVRFPPEALQEVDPVLLLALLHSLTGEGESEDQRIASFFGGNAPTELLIHPLEQLLVGDLAVKTHVARWLREMQAKSKSAELTAALAKFDLSDTPPVVQPMAGVGGVNPPAAGNGVGAAQAAVYKGHTEAEWQRIFLAEQDGASKLDAGHALLFLANGRPQAEVLERVLFVGEEIARAGFGEEAFRLPLRAHALAYTPFPRWTQERTSPRGGDATLDDVFPLREPGGRLDQIIASLTGPIPPATLAATWSTAAVGENPHRAAFALWLLSGQAFSSNGLTPREDVSEEARDIAIRMLDVPVATDLRSQVTALTRFRFQILLPEIAQVDLAEMTSLARVLQDESSPNHAEVSRTFHRLAAFLGTRGLVPVPRDFQRAAAELVLRDLTRKLPGERPVLIAEPFTAREENDEAGERGSAGRSNLGRGGIGGRGGRAAGRGGRAGSNPPNPFHADWLNRQKQRLTGFAQALSHESVIDSAEDSANYVNVYQQAYAYFLDEWPTVAGTALADGTLEPFSEEHDNVVRSLWFVSQLRRPGDDWPVQPAIDELTKVLATFFIPPEQTGAKPADWAAVNPAILLGTILRLGGEVAEFVVTGKSRDEAARQWFERLPGVLQEIDTGSGPQPQMAISRFQRTPPNSELPPFWVEPYRILEWSSNPASEIAFTDSDGLFLIFACWPTTAAVRSLPGGEAETRISRGQGLILGECDPVVILAVLHRLTGDTAERDARIKDFFTERALTAWFRTAVERLLASDLAVKSQVARWLGEMKAKSKSAELTAALAKFVLSAAPPEGEAGLPPPEMVPPASSAAVPPADPAPRAAGPEPVYKGRTESEWQRIFIAETVPEAKLETATALLSLAAGRPDEEIIRHVLDVGAEIVRTGYGDRRWEIAFESTSPSPLAYPNWPNLNRPVRQLTEGSEFAGPMIDFSREHRVRMADVDAMALARGLVEAVKTGDENRAAFALYALEAAGLSGQRRSEPVQQFVFAELDVPIEPTLRSLCTHLRRGYFRNYVNESRDELRQVGDRIARFSPWILNDQLPLPPSAITTFMLFGPHWSGNVRIAVPRDYQRAVARLMFDSLTPTVEEQKAWERIQAGSAEQAQAGRGRGRGFAARGGRVGRDDSRSGFAILSEMRNPAGRSAAFRVLAPELDLPIWSEFFGPGFEDPAMRVSIFAAIEGKDNGFAFRADTLTDFRINGSRYLDEWLPLANSWLDERPGQIDDWKYQRVLASIDLAVAARLESDDWPVEETAKHLRLALASHYDQTHNNQRAVGELSTATLLGPLLRISGSLPDVVSARTRPQADVAAWLKAFDELSTDGNPDRRDPLADLRAPRSIANGRTSRNPTLEEPLAVVRWIVNPESFFSRLGTPASDALAIFQYCARFGGLTDAVTSGVEGGIVRWYIRPQLDGGGLRGRVFAERKPLTYANIDPVVLLAILHDLTGDTEGQDARIEDFFAADSSGEFLVKPIKQYLASDFAVKSHIRRWLNEMAEKSKSAELTAALRKLDPTLAAE